MGASIEDIVADMRRNPAGMRFSAVLRVAEHYFGPPSIRGSHHRFNTPWAGKPLVNLQPDGSMAKAYQVRQLLEAIGMLEQRNKP